METGGEDKCKREEGGRGNGTGIRGGMGDTRHSDGHRRLREVRGRDRGKKR